MLNSIKWNGFLLKDVVKKGKFHYYILENGDEIKAGDFRKQHVEIQCNGNMGWYKRGFQTRWIKNKIFYSSQWLTDGERNPFYGKQHSKELKEKLSKERKGVWYTGKDNPMYNKSVLDVWKEKYPENWEEKYDKWRKAVSDGNTGDKNGFYGKTHTSETINLIKEKNKKTIENRSIEEKNKISINLKKGIKKLREKIGEEAFSEIKARGGRATTSKEYFYKKNNFEKDVEKFLLDKGYDIKYCLILNGKYQYDFRINNTRILIEAQGDYWHANPKLDRYKKEEDLFEFQIEKRKLDKIKYEYAKSYGWKVFYIWENDFRKGNVEKFLKNLEKEYEEI